jgi:hypothetical protein
VFLPQRTVPRNRARPLITDFVYFHPDYSRDARYCWDSQIPTSELVLAGAASSVEKKVGDRSRFDIRWLGAVHAVLDVSYISYLNTFYMDASAILGALTMLTAAVWMLSEVPIQTAPAIWFCAGALLFLGSKPNDAALAFVVAGFFTFARLRRPGQWQRHGARGEPGKHVLTAICVVAMLAVPAWVVMGMPTPRAES